MSTASTYLGYVSKKDDSVSMSRSRPWHPQRPHNALAELPPAIDPETRGVLKRCVRARVALADLNRATELLPSPRMLEISLPMLEAQASSAIENIITSADTMFRYVRAADAADPATREALRYRTALLDGFAGLQTGPLGAETAVRVCSRIKGTPMRVRRDPGTVIGGPTGIVYTPPVGEARIRQLLANWERFLHGSEAIDPLVRMAIAHYQFEAIHPFTDGNGRTGRVLNTLFLVEQGLLSRPILYLSRHIIVQRAEYYRLLLEVTRDRAWEPWLLYMLRGVEETALWTTSKIEAIRRLQEETSRFVGARAPRTYRRSLLDLVFEQPYCRIADVVEAGVAERQTASRYLHALVRIGVLRTRRLGREKLFFHPKLLALLTEESNEFEPYVGG